MSAKKILVINSKGGVGKSTLSSNLASFYACKGLHTALCDFDRHMPGVRWLGRRDSSRPKIDSLTGWEYSRMDDYDWIIMDTPTGMARKDLRSLILRSDAIIIPVLPSPLDFHVAADFIHDLLIYGKIRATEKPLAVVANRTRTNTMMYDQLQRFLQSLKVPIATSIRDSQNYIHASFHGIGIFEMNPTIVGYDLEQWQPLLQWIDRSLNKHQMHTRREHPRALARPMNDRPLLHAVN